MRRISVATVLTVYGIETNGQYNLFGKTEFVATVLTVYGIETTLIAKYPSLSVIVATVLTVYGIETGTVVGSDRFVKRCNSTYRLRY